MNVMKITQVLDLWRTFKRASEAENSVEVIVPQKDCQMLAEALLRYYEELSSPTTESIPVPELTTLTPADREAAGIKQPGKLEEYLCLVDIQRKHHLSLAQFCRRSKELVGQEVSYSTMRRASRAITQVEVERAKSGQKVSEK